MSWEFFALLGFLFLVYSVMGYESMASYHRRCLEVNIIPFKNSNLRMIMASLFCGGITTLILIFAIFDSLEKK